MSYFYILVTRINLLDKIDKFESRAILSDIKDINKVILLDLFNFRFNETKFIFIRDAN